MTGRKAPGPGRHRSSGRWPPRCRSARRPISTAPSWPGDRDQEVAAAEMADAALDGIEPICRQSAEHGGERRETDGRADIDPGVAGLGELGGEPAPRVFVDVLLLVADARDLVHAPFDQRPQ